MGLLDTTSCGLYALGVRMVVLQEEKGGYPQGRSYEQPWLRAAYEGPCHQWTCERSAWYGPLVNRKMRMTLKKGRRVGLEMFEVVV